MVVTLDGLTPKIDPTAFIAPGAVLIGDIEIGPYASIWHGCVLRADLNPIRIGARTNIQDGSLVHIEHGPNGGAFLGQGITVGHGAMLHHCRIEDDVLIGMRAIVMDDAVIGKSCIIAAGSLVSPRTVIPPGVLAMGSPAKVKRDLTPAEMDDLKANNQRYVELSKRYISQGLSLNA